MHVGETIHKIRKEKRMTLVELSSRSGVALATLSRIENEKMTGTIESHMKICEALEISLPELYRNLSMSRKEADVQTKKAKTDVFIRDKHVSAELLATRVSNKKMMPVLLRIANGQATQKEENRAGAEKFIYILDGKIEAGIGNERYALTRGDTLYFDSSIPHQLKNTGNAEARLISVVCPPIL
jgi:transcriptional regulator with XRE-family HTH domain